MFAILAPGFALRRRTAVVNPLAARVWEFRPAAAPRSKQTAGCGSFFTDFAPPIQGRAGTPPLRRPRAGGRNRLTTTPRHCPRPPAILRPAQGRRGGPFRGRRCRDRVRPGPIRHVRGPGRGIREISESRSLACSSCPITRPPTRGRWGVPFVGVVAGVVLAADFATNVFGLGRSVLTCAGWTSGSVETPADGLGGPF